MSKRRTQRHTKSRQSTTQPATTQSATTQQFEDRSESQAHTKSHSTRHRSPIIVFALVLILVVGFVATQRGWFLGDTSDMKTNSNSNTTPMSQSLEGLSIEELESKLAISAMSYIPEPSKTFDVDAWTEQVDKACAGLRASFPKDAKAEHLYGLIQLRLKRTKLAEPSLRRAVELSPQNLQMRADLADLLMQLGQDAEAEQVLNAGNMTGEISGASLAYFLLLADCQARNGDLDSSEGTLLRATQAAPRDASVWIRLAKVQLQQRKPSQAESSARAAIALTSSNAEAWQVLHQSLKLQGRNDESKQALEQFEKYRSQPRVREATTFDEEMSSSMTTIFGSCFRSLAVVYQSNGNQEMAQEMYQRAVQANPQDTATLLGWSNMLRSAGEFRSSIELIRRLIRLQPKDYSNYQNLANLSMELSRPRDAEAALRLACLRLPENGEAHLALANFLLFLNKPGEAKEPAEKANQILGTTATESLVNRIERSLSTAK